MKVLCIDVSSDYDENEILNLLKEGEVYTVVGERHIDNDLCYFLAEYHTKYVFDARRFIPLSEINEMELVTHEQEACIQSPSPSTATKVSRLGNTGTFYR